MRKLEEEVKGLEEESENTANLYAKQQQEFQAELEKRNIELEKKKAVVEDCDKKITDIEKNVAEAQEKIVFMQYFNDKFSNKK